MKIIRKQKLGTKTKVDKKYANRVLTKKNKTKQNKIKQNKIKQNFKQNVLTVKHNLKPARRENFKLPPLVHGSILICSGMSVSYGILKIDKL